jgi:hypothetical protein
VTAHHANNRAKRNADNPASCTERDCQISGAELLFEVFNTAHAVRLLPRRTVIGSYTHSCIHASNVALVIRSKPR